MAFSLDQFYRINRKALIWLLLAVLLWLLRDFFDLVFLTFVIAFFAMPVARWGHERLRLPYRLSLVAVYVLFLGVLAGFVRFVTPNIVGEGTRLIANVGAIQARLQEINHQLAVQYPVLHQPVAGYLRSLLKPEAEAQLRARMAEKRRELDLLPPDAPGASRSERKLRLQLAEEQMLLDSLFTEQAERLQAFAPQMVNFVYQATVTTALALLFSFLILIDLRRLQQHVHALEGSRLHDFYMETAGPVVRFARVVGQGLRAQALIAVVNTVLTLFGLIVLGIPSLAVISAIVFVCSFIPVLGVFISTTPIVLVALNAGGVELALSAVVMIVIVHAIEAYGLNPLIYGRTLHLNPVLTLFVLFLAYHAFGVWGMLLGVPTARYLLNDVLRVALDARKDQTVAAAPTAPAG